MSHEQLLLNTSSHNIIVMNPFVCPFETKSCTAPSKTTFDANKVITEIS